MDHFFNYACEDHGTKANFPFGVCLDNTDQSGTDDNLPTPHDLFTLSDLLAHDNTLFDEISSSAAQPPDPSAAYDTAESERTNDIVAEEPSFRGVQGARLLSTEEVMRVSAAHFVQLSALVRGDPAKLKLPFGLSYSSLAREVARDVELAGLLMGAAEKVSTNELDRANGLLEQCCRLSSSDGNPIQRVVYYFSRALQERIARESGKLISLGGSSNIAEFKTGKDVYSGILTNHSVYLHVNDKLPFTHVLNFTSVQAILDNVASAKRIHIVDLSIKHGMQWTVLMQALATRHACPVDRLRITAVGESGEMIATIGRRLSSFAGGMGLPFEFGSVIVADLEDLRVDMFELEGGETLGVYSDLLMNSLLVKPASLENLMRVIYKLNPRVMTVQDVEAKLNSRSFIERFSEALFFYSAFFDSFDALMEKDDGCRLLIEGGFFSEGIKCVLATEGSERAVRHVGLKVWRSFFARYGFFELQLSDRSIYQANLLVKQYVKDGSCTLERNGYSLISGWKGTPLHFVSAWRLCRVI